MHDDALSDEPRQPLSELPGDKAMLAFIGFGFYLAFQSCTSFSPGLSLMQGFSVEQAAALRVATMAVQVVSLTLAFFQARRILADPLNILTRGTMFISVYFVCAIVLFLVGPIFSLALVAWVFLGLSLSSLSLFWCLILSSSSMRSGVMLFVKAAVLNIVLFLVVALLSPPAVSVLGYASIAVVSMVAARSLFRQAPVKKDAGPFELPVNGRAIVNSYAVPFSVCNGFVVGFFVFAVCEQGLFATVLAMASGILGVASSFALYRLFPEKRVQCKVSAPIGFAFAGCRCAGHTFFRRSRTCCRRLHHNCRKDVCPGVELVRNRFNYQGIRPRSYSVFYAPQHSHVDWFFAGNRCELLGDRDGPVFEAGNRFRPRCSTGVLPCCVVCALRITRDDDRGSDGWRYCGKHVQRRIHRIFVRSFFCGEMRKSR